MSGWKLNRFPDFLDEKEIKKEGKSWATTQGEKASAFPVAAVLNWSNDVHSSANLCICLHSVGSI
jgi:hypothetical protein